MDFLKFETNLSGHKLGIDFPNSKTLILNGMNADDVIYRIESLLSSDYTSYFQNADKLYGFYYKEFDGDSVLYFKNGSYIIASSKTKIVKSKNTIPNIHCIRYLGNGEFRSFITMTDTKHTLLDTNMTKYNSNIPLQVWIRIVETTNKFVGYNYVELKDNKIEFNYKECDFSEEAQKMIYLLISECYLTPPKYERVLLLSNIDLLTTSQQVQFLELLDNFIGHDICISSAKVNWSDISSNSVIKVLNV